MIEEIRKIERERLTVERIELGKKIHKLLAEHKVDVSAEHHRLVRPNGVELVQHLISCDFDQELAKRVQAVSRKIVDGVYADIEASENET